MKKINIKKKIKKLKNFTPPSEILPTETRLSFLRPTNLITNNIEWNWVGKPINSYSFKQIKDTENEFGSLLIEHFKIYNYFLRIKNFSNKVKRIKLFLRWKLLKNHSISLINKERILSLINSFNLLLKIMSKYKFLNKKNILIEPKKVFEFKKLYDILFNKSELLLILNLLTP